MLPILSQTVQSYLSILFNHLSSDYFLLRIIFKNRSMASVVVQAFIICLKNYETYQLIFVLEKLLLFSPFLIFSLTVSKYCYSYQFHLVDMKLIANYYCEPIANVIICYGRANNCGNLTSLRGLDPPYFIGHQVVY